MDSVEAFGNGKVSFADIAAPAIRLAEQGVPVSEINSIAVSRWSHISLYRLYLDSGNIQKS